MGNQIIAWFCQHWLSVLAAVLLVGMMLNGHRRGFLRLSVTLLSVVITLILVRLTLPHVTGFLLEHTGITKAVEQQIIRNSGLELRSAADTDSWAVQDEILSDLEIPEELKRLIRENNTREIWNAMGVERFTQYVAGYLSRTILNVVVFLILFILISLLLHLLINVLDVVTRLPVIHGLNQIAGAVLGLAEGLVLLWVFFLLLGLFRGLPPAQAMLAMVERSPWLSFLYRNNLVGAFLTSFLLAML